VSGPVVRDSTGRAHAYPFLGGLDAPRPQLLDIDGDGDDDLFVQERTGEVMFFERVEADSSGSRGASEVGPPFVWRSDAYRGLEVGEWFRFGDIDMDGDPDLLGEERFSHVRMYRNVGEPGRPEFELATDTLRLVAGDPIFSDRQNVPNVGDVDCDGLQDLLVGRLSGTVTRFEVAESSAEGGPAPRFRLVTDRFQDIEIVNPFMGVRHGANSLVVTDFDGDGDPDLFWGDFFESGLLYIENTGSCANPNLRSEPIPFPPDDPLATSGYNAPTFGDVDGDGDRDLIVGVLGGAYDPLTTAADNLYLLLNLEGRWELRTRRFLSGVDVGSESRPALVDLDGDGDEDLVVAGKIDPVERSTSVMRVYERVGSGPAPGSPAGSSPAWHRNGSLPLRGAYQYAPAFGDLDGDGDPDMILGDWRDELAFYRNEGTGGAEGGAGARWPRFELADSAAATLSRGSHATPTLGDLDGDGDLDLVVGEASGTLNYFRNVGTSSVPRFELVTDGLGGIDVGRRSAPTLVDVDGDGLPDLLVGSESEGIRYVRNVGSPSEPEFVDRGRLDADTRGLSSPILRDLDADGERELLSGSASGGLLWFERRGVGSGSGGNGSSGNGSVGREPRRSSAARKEAGGEGR